MASQLKAKMCRLSAEDREARPTSATEIVQLWLSYAKEFVGETEFLTYQKVPINFNQWHSDIDYRKELARQLGLEFTDAGREKVRSYGGGSSFDGQALNNQGSRMDILHRWQIFKTEDKFWQLFQNDRVIHYAEQIFGKENLPFEYIFA